MPTMFPKYLEPIKDKLVNDYVKNKISRVELAEKYRLTLDNVELTLREGGVYKWVYWDYIEGRDRPSPLRLIQPYVKKYKQRKITIDEISKATGLKRDTIIRHFYYKKIKLWDKKQNPTKRRKPTRGWQVYIQMIYDYFSGSKCR